MAGFLNIQEVAEIFRRHPRTIYRWLEEGFLQGKKVKGGWFIPRSEIERIFNEGDEESTNI